MIKTLRAMALMVWTLAFGAVLIDTKPANAATKGEIGGNDFVREISVVRLSGLRIASGRVLTLETGGSDGVDVSLALFRNTSAADFTIETGDVASDETAFGWMRMTGTMTFNNTTATTQGATILTER